MRSRLWTSVVATSLVCVAVLVIALGLGWSPKLGLDLEGGLSVVYAPVQTVSTAKLDQAAQIMNDRVNGLGVSGSTVTTQGNQVVVDIPGIKDPNKALAILGTTAQLFFRPVLTGVPAYSGKRVAKGTAGETAAYPTLPPLATTSPYYYSASYWVGGTSATAGLSPPNPVDTAYAAYPTASQVQDAANQSSDIILDAGPNPYGAARYLLGPVQATGTIIKSAYASLSQGTGWVVVFNLTSSGSPKFNAIAQKYYHQLVANDLDGTIVSAPQIESTSFNGSGQISGSFNQTSANKLALELNYGALPVILKRLSTQSVSATLGKSSLEAGVLAGLLGLLLVMIYTIVYYRALGVVVVVGLLTTAAFLFGFISILGASSLGLRLDLAGVTGLIVSVGITVDSYVVYFERLKDEIRAGRSIRSSVDKSFRSAYRTILSADAVSFIAALVLWLLSVGTVRGFAFMLGLSTLVDVATSYFFTRPFVILLGRNRIVTGARWLGMASGLDAGTDHRVSALGAARGAGAVP